MTVSEKVIAILNKDEAAKKLNKAFNKAAKERGLTGKELEDTRQSFLMMLISKNPEAMSVMAREAYEHFNQA
jgi:hypothetical protein